MIKIAVIQFPGSNCEYETARAVESVGLEAVIFRWNKRVEILKEFDGFILPGGFSYQDRVRAGAIAAKEEILDVILQETEAGKPVLGICNGAQILMEAGMVPGIHWEKVEMALAPNEIEHRKGYYSNWIFLKTAVTKHRSTATYLFEENQVFPTPIAHAEGRFTTDDPQILDQLVVNNQIILQYCTSEGQVKDEFPTNPNGSVMNIAAICNKPGNVVAMMPHPERGNWLKQVPTDLGDKWSKAKMKAKGNYEAMNDPGPGRKIFQSIKAYIENR